MTAQDAPIFDPDGWGLTDQQIELTTLARQLGQDKFAARAPEIDKKAAFPTENYKDLARAGLMGIAIPKSHGGHGADFKTYMLTAAEIGRYCGSTALTFNMHVCSCLWSGYMLDHFDLAGDVRAAHNANRDIHYKRILDEGAIYSRQTPHVSHKADRGREHADHAGADQSALVSGHHGGRSKSVARKPAARLDRAIYRHGKRQ